MRKRIISIAEAAVAALFLALIISGAYISIQIGPIPIVLQNFFVLLSALLLPARLSIIVLIAYLVAGTFGLPVFAGGKGGLAHLLGPTGGYLLGYLPAVFVSSLFIRKLESSSPYISRIGATFIFLIIVYLCAIPWLMGFGSFSFQKALMLGLYPFIPFDLLKGVVAVFISFIAAGELKSVLKR